MVPSWGSFSADPKAGLERHPSPGEFLGSCAVQHCRGRLSGSTGCTAVTVWQRTLHVSSREMWPQPLGWGNGTLLQICCFLGGSAPCVFFSDILAFSLPTVANLSLFIIPFPVQLLCGFYLQIAPWYRNTEMLQGRLLQKNILWNWNNFWKCSNHIKLGWQDIF